MPDNKTVVVQLVARFIEQINKHTYLDPEELEIMDELKERLHLGENFTDRDFLIALLKEMKDEQN